MTKDKKAELLTFDTGRITFSANKADIAHVLAEDYTENNPWKDQPVDNVMIIYAQAYYTIYFTMRELLLLYAA